MSKEKIVAAKADLKTAKSELKVAKAMYREANKTFLATPGQDTKKVLNGTITGLVKADTAVNKVAAKLSKLTGA